MERSLPHNDGAERATLGAIFLDREAIVPIAVDLQPSDFYTQKHAWVYEAQLACYSRRTPPDLTTVADELRRADRLDAIGGVPYLIDLSNGVPTAFHVEFYAKIVRRAAFFRRLIQAGGKISALGFDDSGEEEQALAEATALLAATQRGGGGHYIPLAQSLEEYYQLLVRAEEADGAGMSGLPTGFIDFDRLTGGLHRSDLIILAARPGVGKTSRALGIAYNVALAGGVPGIVSLEMGREQLTQRLIAMHAGIDSQKLRTARLSSEELVVVMDTIAQLAALPIKIDDAGAQTVASIRTRAHQLQAEHGLDVLIIDYLQLVSGSGHARDRVQEVSEVSRQLKALARELNVPVIALSQLSRAVEGRASHVPMLADLRESGSIENDADMVVFIYREELYDKNTDKRGIAELHIAKHRNGPLGTVCEFFDARTTRFRDLASYSTPEGY